ncbi:MAG TPA: polysaccharide deacetylase family protein [Rhodanobacter sp.]
MTPGKLPVLMYHGLHAGETDPGRFDPVYSVTPAAFAAQLDWLHEHGYRSVRLDDTRTGRDKQVVISFDDGDVSNLTVALPLLAERGMTAECFVTSDFIGAPGMLTVQDVHALAEAGIGVQSHGRSHRFLEDLDDDAMYAELRDSKARLEAASGRPVTALAFPGGRGGSRERDVALRLGYRHVLGSQPGPNRDRRAHECYERIAITREVPLGDFASLVAWRGWRPRYARARFRALRVPKQLLGNDRYQRLRAKLLTR